VARPKPAPHRITWEQEPLLPPAHITIELRLHLDGPRGTAGWSLAVFDGLESTQSTVRCRPVGSTELIYAEALEVLAAQFDLELLRLSPF